MIDLKNKNILYITHSYKDWIKDPIESLAKQFNHVYVLVAHKPIADILSNFDLKWLTALEQKVLGVSHNIYRFKTKFDTKNIPDNVTVIPVNLWYIPFSWWIDMIGDYHYKKVLRIINKYNFRFDIIHSHIVWSAGYVGMKLKQKFNKPFVLTAHGRDIYLRPYESRSRMNNTVKILNSADRIITVSEMMKNSIRKLTNRFDIRVIPNGFKMEKFTKLSIKHARKELGFGIEKKIITITGNIERIKGHKYLIESVSNLVKEFPQLLVIIIGDGPDRLALEKRIKYLGIENHFKFTGYVPNEMINIYNSASDLFVLPSLGEGNPTVMFEALASGLPFIGTNVGGIPEIINDDCGIVVEPKSIDSLTDAIRIGLKKKWDREGIRAYAKKFEWSNLTKTLVEEYKGLE